MTTVLFASVFVGVAVVSFAVGYACGWGAGFREGMDGRPIATDPGPQSIGEAVDAGHKVRWDYEAEVGVN
jgi:hypothetical protein